MDNTYEVIIIGGGPAGLSAGIYASRARLHTLLIEKGIFGGQITNAMHVENYPGFPNGISGFDLGELMHQQATRYDLETRTAETSGIKPGDSDILIKTNEGDFTAKAVIVAAGTSAEWVQRYLQWHEQSKAATRLRQVCGVLIIFAGLYLIYTAR